MASTEPWVSALTTTRNTLFCAASSDANRFSSVTFERFSKSWLLATMARSSASARAAFSSSTELNSQPASGTPFKPSTLTATDGPASLSRWPSSLMSARTLP